MKELSLIFLMSLITLFNSCSSSSRRYPGLDSMLDYYCYHHGDFPNSLEELERFSTLGIYDSAFIDTLLTTTSHLNEDIKMIEWVRDDCFPCNHLLISIHGDTIAYRTNNNRFYSLDDLIYWYTYCYGTLPTSSDALLSFMNSFLEATKFKRLWKHDSRSWEYDRLTVQNFKKCKDNGLLNLLTTDDSMLIVVRDDTIANWSSCEAGNSFCHILPCDIVLFHPRFYDCNGSFSFCDDSISESFSNGIKALRYGRGEALHGGINGWHIIRFHIDNGLHPLCAEDDVILDTKWCNELVSFAKSFSEEHGFGEIIFATPIFD